METSLPPSDSLRILVSACLSICPMEDRLGLAVLLARRAGLDTEVLRGSESGELLPLPLPADCGGCYKSRRGPLELCMDPDSFPWDALGTEPSPTSPIGAMDRPTPPWGRAASE